MRGDLQGPAQRFCEDVALWAEIPSKAGVALDSAALPLRDHLSQHAGPVCGSCLLSGAALGCSALIMLRK